MQFLLCMLINNSLLYSVMDKKLFLPSISSLFDSTFPLHRQVKLIFFISLLKNEKYKVNTNNVTRHKIGQR
uniref:Uncharacterized protein n=1 Tax=Brugia timori TaxID=42155 RepID=A0A0R3R8A2_9BILA